MLVNRDYLDAMGIDVWSIRPALALRAPVPEEPNVAGPAVAQKAGKSPVEAVPAEAAKESPPVEADVPNFRLALLHYEVVGLCVSLQAEQQLPRDFCDAIARVLGADVKKLKYQELAWPMLNVLNASGIDQSIHAARQVVKQMFQNLPAQALAFGEDMGNYFEPLKEAKILVPVSVESQTWLPAPSLLDLMQSVDAKRQLFTALHHWQTSPDSVSNA